MNIVLLEDMVKTNLEKCLNKAEKQFYRQDGELVAQRPKGTDSDHHAAERSVVFRYGIYLFRALKENDLLCNFHIDCEYNLDMDGFKSMHGHLCYPDLIIHKRGSNEFNLLIVECKGWWSTPASAEEAKNKIRFFMDPHEKYTYSYGLLLTFGKHAIRYEWIEP